MGVFDKGKDLAGEHPEQVEQGIEKGGDFADEKTGGKHADQVDKGQQAATEHLGGGGGDQTEEGQQPPQ